MDNQQGELEINRYYLFKLIKTTVMPDEVEYYVMEDPFGKKHLMEKEPYDSYGFELGQEVEIRIDKVNCKGKVFFEPKHPRYSLGASVQAKYLGRGTEYDKFKEEMLVLRVQDPEGDVSWVRPINPEQRKEGFQADYLTCVVSKISRGKLILEQIG